MSHGIIRLIVFVNIDQIIARNGKRYIVIRQDEPVIGVKKRGVDRQSVVVNVSARESLQVFG